MNKTNSKSAVSELVSRIFLLLAVFPLSSSGQVIVSSDDLLGLIGSSVRVSIDESSMLSVDVGNAGANQEWDFTALTPSEETTERSFHSPSGTPFESTFPGANFAFRVSGFEADGGVIYQYLRVESNALFLRGAGVIFTDPDTTFVLMGEEELLTPMPLSMGVDFWESAERDTLGNIDVAGVIMSDSTHSVVDAWGVVHVGAGSFDVIRIRGDEFQKTETYAGGQIVSTTSTQSINYEWISPTHFIVVSISSLDDEQNPNFTVAGTVEILSAVTTDTEEEGLTGNEKLDLETYPNPFSGFLTMEINGQRGPVHIEVVDLLGRRVRTVYSGRLDSRTVFKWNGRDEAGRMLPNGMYFVRFESSSQIGIKPVTLLK